MFKWFVDWTGADEDEGDVNVWEDNWDDDNIEDDFSQQLRWVSMLHVDSELRQTKDQFHARESSGPMDEAKENMPAHGPANTGNKIDRQSCPLRFYIS